MDKSKETRNKIECILLKPNLLVSLKIPGILNQKMIASNRHSLEPAASGEHPLRVDIVENCENTSVNQHYLVRC